ncbi:hypothetical protein [uncultured Nostoc sp.]|uniref:hypothetical protein n=1 Tax=uncultured Nostoc sp. TaxID=340711 RepID=UPI0035C9B6BD
MYRLNRFWWRFSLQLLLVCCLAIGGAFGADVSQALASSGDYALMQSAPNTTQEADSSIFIPEARFKEFNVAVKGKPDFFNSNAHIQNISLAPNETELITAKHSSFLLSQIPVQAISKKLPRTNDGLKNDDSQCVPCLTTCDNTRRCTADSPLPCQTLSLTSLKCISTYNGGNTSDKVSFGGGIVCNVPSPMKNGDSCCFSDGGLIVNNPVDVKLDILEHGTIATKQLFPTWPHSDKVYFKSGKSQANYELTYSSFPSF